MSGQSKRRELLKKVQERAEKLYGKDLEYHNFEHALKVLGRAREIVRYCEKKGFKFDEQVIEVAALFHDAGYHEKLKKEGGYETKEEYSASLSKETLSEMSEFSEEFIQKVEAAILGTDPFIDVEKIKDLSIEAKILRVSDVAGMASDFDEFVNDSINLKLEWEMMNNGGNEISWDEWKKKSSFIIEQYLKGDIYLADYYNKDVDGFAFYEAVSHNLSKFLDSNDEDINRNWKSR